MTFLFANSLVDGFFKSNGIGQGIVLIQICCSVVMVAAVIGKGLELHEIRRAMHGFFNDFTAGKDVLECFLRRRSTIKPSGPEIIYRKTCEQLIKKLSQENAMLLTAAEGAGSITLTAREVELMRGTCEHELDDQTIRVEEGTGMIATVVALSPMLGLLGTVWGVLDAFYEMGSAGSANLATIAPSISSALVTTVIGLMVAIPGVIAFNIINARIRSLTSAFEGFADELMGRIACEFQGKGD